MILLEGENCYLRILQEEDSPAFTNMLSDNRNYWTIFEPRQEASFYTVSTQRKRLESHYFK